MSICLLNKGVLFDSAFHNRMERVSRPASHLDRADAVLGFIRRIVTGITPRKTENRWCLSLMFEMLV